jgi:hypothetical protein
MGKRSDFERKPRDWYPTPEAGVLPLLPHLAPNTSFIEPCAGDGALIGWLEKHGHKCVDAIDIEPLADGIEQANALECEWDARDGLIVLTNPPWRRDILHTMIEHFRKQMPTWLLLDADWAHTRQAAPYMRYCSKIVSIGRLKWIPDSKMSGKDNCAWLAFEAEPVDTVFIPRT